MKYFILLLLIAVLLLTGCRSKPVTGETVMASEESYKIVSARDLHILLKDKDFLLVNVHIPFAGNIPETDLSIPFDQVKQNISQLPADRNAKIVLYCRSGRMSQIATETLVSLGYTNISDVTGGMVAWEQAGYPIDR